MIILPAIDLYGGKAVRLLKGSYADMTVYSEDPLSLAKDFERMGATHLHAVDLEGAKDGTTPHLELISKIAAETSLKIEIGGGIRTMEKVEKYISAGVDKVIIGTAAVTDGDFLREAAQKYGGKIAVGADVRDGYIAIKGWLEKSPLTLEALIERVLNVGVKNIICTDISKDGAMNGTNLGLYRALSKKYTADITASGGISSIDDIKALKLMNIYGAIVGKAYYIGAIDLKEAIEVAK